MASTGSTDVGRLILKAATKSNLNRVTLEMSRKSPKIIFADVDLDEAVEGARVGQFSNQERVCSAGSRLYIEESTYDSFVQKNVDYAAGASLAILWTRRLTGTSGRSGTVRQGDGLY